jgi:hypothetical protein
MSHNIEFFKFNISSYCKPFHSVEITPVFLWVHVTQPLVFCVVFCGSYFCVFLSFFEGQSIQRPKEGQSIQRTKEGQSIQGTKERQLIQRPKEGESIQRTKAGQSIQRTKEEQSIQRPTLITLLQQ